MSNLATKYRTHTCGALRAADATKPAPTDDAQSLIGAMKARAGSTRTDDAAGGR